jgi:hypothetical protein
MAESLGLLKQMGAYGISRIGYYEQMTQKRPQEFAEVRERFGRRQRFAK